MNRATAKGFTLLEVLLALAVLALVGIPVMQTVRENMANTHTLQQTTLARWVADNEMEQIHLEGRWPGREWSKHSRMQGDSEWQVRRRSVETGNDDFRMIEVEVRALAASNNNSQAPVLASLQSYMYRR
ncbi:type II secretion system minor pseudopilin GspI [Parendozoicomonas haliclonae]|uniref:Type II secretion system protein I n=1 Tax=Parendozoicomonas haliclonae TaxID=1960125 RepID=A0A1X7AH12_9GAMM|nr:type II secretion system minor pseudopilin GspI [Parendozoicomonas haliclonae]SMA39996.1 Bacterial type II secretion system protein I/J [Parendozoicomonas haliclonae]